VLHRRSIGCSWGDERLQARLEPAETIIEVKKNSQNCLGRV